MSFFFFKMVNTFRSFRQTDSEKTETTAQYLSQPKKCFPSSEASIKFFSDRCEGFLQFEVATLPSEIAPDSFPRVVSWKCRMIWTPLLTMLSDDHRVRMSADAEMVHTMDGRLDTSNSFGLSCEFVRGCDA